MTPDEFRRMLDKAISQGKRQGEQSNPQLTPSLQALKKYIRQGDAALTQSEKALLDGPEEPPGICPHCNMARPHVIETEAQYLALTPDCTWFVIPRDVRDSFIERMHAFSPVRTLDRIE